MGIHDRIRVPFLVKAWDEVTNTGTVVDREGIVYEIAAESLDVTAQGRAYVGEQLSGYAEGPTRVSDLLPDLQLSHDRESYESKGPSPDVGWELKTGSPNYACSGRATAKPHDGKFSNGREPKVQLKDAFAGLDRLGDILTERIEELSLEQRRLMEKTNKNKEN
jgi:hypothetical protein